MIPVTVGRRSAGPRDADGEADPLTRGGDNGDARDRRLPERRPDSPAAAPRVNYDVARSCRAIGLSIVALLAVFVALMLI